MMEMERKQSGIDALWGRSRSLSVSKKTNPATGMRSLGVEKSVSRKEKAEGRSRF